MKDPCTVREAIQQCEQQQKGKRSEVEGRIQTVYSSGIFSVDLVAVAVRRCVRHQTDPPCAEVWIADHSLETNKTSVSIDNKVCQAMVTVFGSKAVNDLLDQNKGGISERDIVRFNGLSLRRKYIKESEQPQKGGKSRTTTYVFVQSWENPIIGPPFFSIGSTNPEITNSTRIPESMETGQARIRALRDWYQMSKYANASEARLSSLPCQRQTLEDIMSSLGTISHVMVNVVRMEAIIPQISPTKRNRRVSKTPSKLHIAMVTDGAGHNQVAFMHQDNRLVTMLQKAVNANQPVMLHNIICRKGRDAPLTWALDHQQWDEEVLIMATSTTYVALLPREALATTTTRSNHQLGYLSMDQTQPFLSDTQQSQHPQQKSTQHTVSSSVTVMGAPLIAIEYQQETLTKDNRAGSSNSRIVSLLLQANGNAYNKAILHADHRGAMGQQQTTVKIHADACGMQELCGGVEASELQNFPNLQKHVVAFLQGVLEDKIMLRWKIRKDTNKAGGEYFRLEKVTLIKL